MTPFNSTMAALQPVDSFEDSALDGRLKEQGDRPKVLLACRVFGASGQPWLWRQALGLHGLRRELLCWERRNPAVQAMDDIPVHILSGDPAPYDGSRRWWQRLRNLPSRNSYGALGSERTMLDELIQRIKPAVILCNFGDIAMRLLPVALDQKIPLVAYLHGDFNFASNRWYRWSLCECLEHFAAIVVVTQAERKWLLTQGFAEDRIHVIPCGAPTELFRPGYARQSNKVRFVMVSRLAAEKGCDLSIRAFAIVASKLVDAELQIYGDGPARAELHNLVEGLGLQGRASFHGYVDEAQLMQALPFHDVFIQHSRWKEGSPVSIVEAMACGLPVVATPVGGIVDQVLNGVNGFLVNEGDVRAMADAMFQLASDSELRKNLGNAGLKRARELYDSSLQNQRLQQVLMSVVDVKSN